MARGDESPLSPPQRALRGRGDKLPRGISSRERLLVVAQGSRGSAPRWPDGPARLVRTVDFAGKYRSLQGGL